MILSFETCSLSNFAPKVMYALVTKSMTTARINHEFEVIVIAVQQVTTTRFSHGATRHDVSTTRKGLFT